MSKDKVNYTIAVHNDQLVLVMNARTAGLVKSAWRSSTPTVNSTRIWRAIWRWI